MDAMETDAGFLDPHSEAAFFLVVALALRRTLWAGRFVLPIGMSDAAHAFLEKNVG
jgi:hypothetical protein